MKKKDLYQQNVSDLVEAVKNWGVRIPEMMAEFEENKEEELFYDELKNIGKSLEKIGIELAKRLKKIGNIQGLKKELIPFDERHKEYYQNKKR